VKKELENHFPGKTFEIDIVKTKGDKILDVSLSKIGDKDLFHFLRLIKSQLASPGCYFESHFRSPQINRL
jgi:porphobilinogen deaminase